MKIIIKELIGDNAITMEKGKVLYQVLNKALPNKIEIDFTNVLVASPFFNASISYLLKDYSIQELQKYLEIKGLSQNSKNILNLSISNGIKHYKN